MPETLPLPGSRAPGVIAWIVLVLGIALTGFLYFEAVREETEPAEVRVLKARPVAIIGAGVLVSGLLFGIIWSPTHARFRALAAAHRMTASLQPGLNRRRLADLLGPERPSMKVVFASGYFDDRGVLAPGSDFIQKPFNPEALARAVRRALDRKGSHPA